MLNDFAVDFIIQSDQRIWLASLALALVGGAFSALLFTSTGRMARTSYFLGNCVIVLVAALSQAALIPTPLVIERGTLWAMALLWAFAQFACGFALWRLAAMRSRDAYGNAKAAVLSFIPFVNFWLLVAPSGREDAVVVRPTYSARMAFGVVIGLALLGGAQIVTKEIDARTRDAVIKEATLSVGKELEYLLNKDGLEKALVFLTHSSAPSYIVKGRVLLEGIEADGNVLIRKIRFTDQDQSSPYAMVSMARMLVCYDQGYIALLRAGASIRQTYQGKFDRDLGAVVVSLKDCGL